MGSEREEVSVGEERGQILNEISLVIQNIIGSKMQDSFWKPIICITNKKSMIETALEQMPRSQSSISNSFGNVHGRLNASWKICSLAVNGQSFLVIDGYL